MAFAAFACFAQLKAMQIVHGMQSASQKPQECVAVVSFVAAVAVSVLMSLIIAQISCEARIDMPISCKMHTYIGFVVSVLRRQSRSKAV